MPPSTEDHEFRKRVGRSIAVARQRLGLSQPELAERLGLPTQSVQRWEGGKVDLRLGSLQRLAEVLGVKPGALIDADPPPDASRSARPRGPLLGLTKAGWRKATPSTVGAVQVLDLRPEAGPGRSRELPRAVAWAEPVSGHTREEGLFLARVVGDSMLPDLADGQWLLFTQRFSADDLLGKMVLVRTMDDPDLAGWQVKRVSSLREDDEGRRFLTLQSRNRAYPDQQVAVDGSGHVDVVAVVKAALRAR